MNHRTMLLNQVSGQAHDGLPPELCLVLDQHSHSLANDLPAPNHEEPDEPQRMSSMVLRPHEHTREETL